MSERARDVVRYLKHLEDGPVYRTEYVHLPPSRPHWDTGNAVRVTVQLPWAVLVPDADTSKARMLDALNPLENALAAVQYIKALYGDAESAWETYKGEGYG